ncbi:hypothetical protein RRG08_048666 [Elysia crispata]|uniref:Uncharacterized protein n=1 Tax=Elysia crispata TaxID=231223 RepID=A0AAE1AF44_9GAST|nr:hypothetical protein RRG08_048666 [Elysia crispata]
MKPAELFSRVVVTLGTGGPDSGVLVENLSRTSGSEPIDSTNDLLSNPEIPGQEPAGALHLTAELGGNKRPSRDAAIEKILYTVQRSRTGGSPQHDPSEGRRG